MAETNINIKALLKQNVDVGVISLSDDSDNFDWSPIISNPKYSAIVDRNSADLETDLYNALGRVKVDFFYGGCETNILSPSWLRIVSEEENRAEISWEPMVGLDSYLLSRTNPGEEPDTEISIPKEESSHVIDNLEPGKQFDIFLSAVKTVEDVPITSDTPNKATIWTRPTPPKITSTTTAEYSAAVTIG